MFFITPAQFILSHYHHINVISGSKNQNSTEPTDLIERHETNIISSLENTSLSNTTIQTPVGREPQRIDTSQPPPSLSVARKKSSTLQEESDDLNDLEDEDDPEDDEDSQEIEGEDEEDDQSDEDDFELEFNDDEAMETSGTEDMVQLAQQVKPKKFKATKQETIVVSKQEKSKNDSPNKPKLPEDNNASKPNPASGGNIRGSLGHLTRSNYQSESGSSGSPRRASSNSAANAALNNIIQQYGGNSADNSLNNYEQRMNLQQGIF